MQLETARLLLYPMTAEQLLQSEHDFDAVLSSFGAVSDHIGFWEMFQKRRIYRAKVTWIHHYPESWLISTAWLIVRKTDRRMLGEAGFKGPAPERTSLEIGYSIRPPFRRQGYMTEAVGALCRFAFTQSRYPVKQVTALTRPDNVASHRVLEKSGFARLPNRGKYWHWGLDKDSAHGNPE